MSTFRRNLSNKSGSSCPAGFHPSHYNGIPTASTGIASLDDVLGGGLPVSSSFIIDEDVDGSYAKLVLRYWIAQGISSRQHLIVVGSSLDEGGDPNRVIERLMSSDANQDHHPEPAPPSLEPHAMESHHPEQEPADDSDEDDITIDPKHKHMKIAWRYEALGKHQAATEAYDQQARCHSFDLSKTMQLSSEQRTRIHCIDSGRFGYYAGVLDAIEGVIQAQTQCQKLNADGPLSFRIAIQSLGSAGWPPCPNATIYRFLIGLKAIMRTATPTVCMITFPSKSYPPQLRQMLPWAVQGYMSLESFSGNDRTQAAFPNHQGAVNFIRLPTPASLLPPATKLSVLRGLGGTSSEARIDSNLGFKLGRRKGFRIEMMGLGLDLDSEAVSEAPRPAPGRQEEEDDDAASLVAITKPPKLKGPKIASRVRFGEVAGDEHAPSKHSAKDLRNTDW